MSDTLSIPFSTPGINSLGIAPPFIFPFINATPNLVNYDFTWDFGDGTVIATNDTNITHEYQYNGVYTAKLIAEDMVNNCGVDTLEKVNLINCSGGPSLSIEEAYSNLVLYPNPARYVVNIDYGTEKDYNNIDEFRTRIGIRKSLILLNLEKI